jgi:hypothetical protein
MPYSEPRRRNSINPRQILGRFAGGGSISAASSGGATSGATLQADYELVTPYSVNIAPNDWGFVAINTDTENQSNPQVSSQTPWTFTVASEGSYRIEAYCTIEPDVDVKRYCLAIKHGVSGSTSDALFSFHRVKRSATEYELFVTGIVSLEINDVLTIELRAYNTSNAVKPLGVQAAQILVYSV